MHFVLFKGHFVIYVLILWLIIQLNLIHFEINFPFLVYLLDITGLKNPTGPV